MIYTTAPDIYAVASLTAFARTLLDDTNSSVARTTLGLVINTDVQQYDAGLASIAGLNTSADKMIYTTASDTYAVTSLTTFARTLLDDNDSSSARATLGLVINTDVQGYDAGLASIAGLTTDVDKMIYTSANDVYAVTSLTSFARTLLDDNDSETARTTLGLVINTNVQEYDVGLASIAELISGSDKMLYTSAHDVYAVTSLTAFARTILDDADASTVRATLELGTAATKNTGISSGDIPVLNGTGKLENAVLPALAITETYVAANETEQLALNIQKGDVCIRTDETKSYINSTGNNLAMSDWQELLTPEDGVLSISAGNGMEFSAITSSGSITMGTPNTCNTESTNTLTATSHAHQISGFLPLVGGTITSNNTIKFRDSAIHIGSLNDGYLDFTVDTAFRFNTGKVGIGEINPAEKLDIVGNVLCKSGHLKVRNEGYEQIHYMFIGGYAPYSPANRQINIAQMYSGVGAKQYIFLNGTLGDASTYATQTVTSSYANIFGFEASESRFNILTQSPGTNLAPIRALTVDPTGRIGMGTTNPLSILHIEKATTSDMIRLVDSTQSKSTFFGFFAGSLFSMNFSGQDFAIHTGSSEKVRILQTGYFGIGTSNPSSLLHIKTASGTSDLCLIETTTSNEQAILNLKGVDGTAHAGGKIRFTDGAGGYESIILGKREGTNTNTILSFSVSRAVSTLNEAMILSCGNTQASLELRGVAGTANGGFRSLFLQF